MMTFEERARAALAGLPSQGMRVVEKHVSEVRVGDEIWFDGHVRTVCKKDIGRDPFMGSSVFGDSFKLGTEPVKCFEAQRFYAGKPVRN